MFGIATSPDHTRKILDRWPHTFEIVQIEDDLERPLPEHSGQLVTHSVIRADNSPERALRRALLRNKSGVVLFSSSNPEHIKANVKLTEDVRTLSAQSAKFISLSADSRPLHA